MPSPDKSDSSFLSNVLQILSMNKKTGILEVRKGKDKVQIVLKNGIIVYVTGSDPKERLGYLLIRNGYLTKEHLQDSLAVATEKRQFLGKVVVENGYLTEKELRLIVRKQAERILYNLFLLEKGNFEFKEKDVNLDGSVSVELPVMSVLLEASRHISEVIASQKIITKDSHKLKVIVNKKDKPDLSLTQEESTVIGLVDKGMTVRQVIQKSGYHESTVYKILYSLISSGIIQQ